MKEYSVEFTSANAGEATSVGEDYPRQQARCRELLAVYRTLPGGVGAFGAAMIEDVLREADAAALSGDLVRLLRSYQAMKGCE